ncbi:MAG: 6,7-dimethyl-8-ribityllumazine synthase [Acidimicrobiia bacterium]
MTSKGRPDSKAAAASIRGKGRGLKVGVIVSRFNEEITKRLLEGALEGLAEAGVKKRSQKVLSVPGSFELAGAAKKLAQSGKVDAVVCLGAVIKGESEHFTFVASAAQQGILQAGLETGIPITFGVLTVENIDQALARSGGADGNSGYEAALDAVEMANLYQQIEGVRGE